MKKNQFGKTKIIILPLLLSLVFKDVAAQKLKLKPRLASSPAGKEFGKSIVDSTLTLKEREKLIYKQIKRGNVPSFLRKLSAITDTILLKDKITTVRYYVIPDYLAIGTDTDYLYMPMTPILAQKVARLTRCILPTKKMVDMIYSHSEITLRPQPIPPSKAMTTVPLFMAHNDSVKLQLQINFNRHQSGALTAGNKKDVIITNKIYSEKLNKVVIYGWHKLDGKPIQPLYSKHTNLWVDYSHGIRLIQGDVFINNRKHRLKQVLKNVSLAGYFSDEGPIVKPFYPITSY